MEYLRYYNKLTGQRVADILRDMIAQWVAVEYATRIALDSGANRFELRDERGHRLPVVVDARRFAAADVPVGVAERDHDDIERRFGTARHAKRSLVRPGLALDVQLHRRAAAKNSSTCVRGVA